MKDGQSKQVPFHGILAVGSTKDEAVNRYRLLALGKGVSAYADQSQNISFVTSSDNSLSEMFNPHTGDLDLEKNTSLAESLVFEAQAGDVEATHYICVAGCGTHLVYDSEELVKFCPVCTSAVVASSEDDGVAEDEEEEDDGADLNLDDDEDDSDSDSDDEDDSDSDSDDEDMDSDSDDEDMDSESSDEEEEEEDDEEEDDEEEDDSESEDDGSPIVVAANTLNDAKALFKKHIKSKADTAAIASDEDVEAEYKVCTSKACGAHVLTGGGATATECPACHCALKEPAVAGADGKDCEPDSGEKDDEDLDDAEDDLSILKEDEDAEDGEDMNKKAESAEAAPVAAPVAETNPASLMDVDALNQIDDTGEEAHKSLDLSYSSSIAGKPMWTAYFDGKPVATAHSENVGKNSDIFSDATFGHAVIASARHVGVRNILRDMGFRGIQHSVAIAPIVKAAVGKEVATAKSELERDRKEYSERLLSALATAAIGINRGFFSDTKNPLKEKLWDALASAGIKNPESLIHNAFRASSDAYHSTLFAKATEIIAKPLEIQESLAKAVIGTNYLVSSSSAAESGTDSSEIENRVGQLGTVTAAATASSTVSNVVVPTGASNKIANVVSALGRRR